MANYYGATRTNYFKVTDMEKFKEILQNTYITEDENLTFIEDGDGKVGFYCQGSIVGMYKIDDNGDEEADFDLFLSKLQEILVEDDAILITEIGREKMCYFVGNTLVITKNKIDSVDLGRNSIELAKEILGNPDWDTKNAY